MKVLADTNVLLRWIDQGLTGHTEAHTSIEALLARGHDPCMVAQNAIEFWNVSTRPSSRNGRGLEPPQVAEELAALERFCIVLEDTPAVYEAWKRIVAAVGVRGVQVHDARLAAVMAVHGITHILTFNGDDFRRYPDVTVIDPREAAAL